LSLNSYCLLPDRIYRTITHLAEHIFLIQHLTLILRVFYRVKQITAGQLIQIRH